MVNFTFEQLRALMDQKQNIRNMAVIAHVDHGKTSLTDSLVASSGIMNINQAGDIRFMSARDDEKNRGITIKSAGISLYFKMPETWNLPSSSQGREFLVNLIDSPGHVDFSSEVTTALRVTDGALVVVDCVEGVAVQTKTVLRQALLEKTKPVLTVNKLDRCFLELKLDHEAMYQNFLKSIENVNIEIALYRDERLGDINVYPELGNVAFSAGLHGWAFTLNTFARMYSNRYKIDEKKLMKRLWGDNYYDSETKKWYKVPISDSGKPLKRSFCQFILEPIQEVFDACLNQNNEALNKILESQGIKLSTEEKNTLQGKSLLKRIMQKWLPAADALFEMIIQHLPSPVVAQRYRVENLYSGPLDDETAQAIRTCDPNGPLCIFISKMVPTPDKTRFFAFGRIFSGTISSGQKVNILGSNFEMGKSADFYEGKTIQRTLIMMGSKTESFESVPCGNIVALVGIDTFIIKSATLTTLSTSHPLRAMKYSVSPVVRVAVEPKNPLDLPKLIEGLKRLVRGDSLVQVSTESSGEHIIAGAGELHLQICLNDLQNFFMNGAEIVISDPIVPLRETISAVSEICLSKAPNRLNRLMANAEPVSEKLATEIDNGILTGFADDKERARYLTNNHNWDINNSRKIWCFAPDGNGTNVLVDTTKAVEYLSDIKDSIVAMFDATTKEGVLCEEPLRGMRLNLVDANIHSDRSHRGSGQIMPATRRIFYACELLAKPRIMEPFYLVDIQVTLNALSGVYSTMTKRRGYIFETKQASDTPICNIKGYLPVMESFGFTADLRAQTAGQAFPQCVFDHWEIVPGDPFEEGSLAHKFVMDSRKRKGLKETIPALDEFLDKL